MNDTTLLLLTDTGYQSVDIFGEIPISVTYSELDIAEIDSRKSPYSLTFILPGTSNNNTIFEHFYEINGVDFNPLNDAACVVQYKGLDIFRGNLRLNKVIKFYDRVQYEVYITSQVSTLSSVLGATTLPQLNWSNYIFDMNYTSITTSWSANTQTNEGLFNGDVLMPMINYGYIIQSGTTFPDFEFSMDNDVLGGSITFSGNPIPPLYFKPAIRIKAVIDNIFSGTGFNYVSEFFDTDYFRSIYMDTAQNGEIGAIFPSGNTNENFFKVYSPYTPFYYLPSNGLQQSFPFTQFGSDGFDGLGNFFFWNASNPSQTGYFRVPYSGAYFFNMRFTYEAFNPTPVPCYFRVRVRSSNTTSGLDTGNIFWQSGGLGFPAINSKQVANIFFSGVANAGDLIKPYIFLDQGNTNAGVYITAYESLTIQDEAPMWDLYGSPFLSNQTTINLQFQMPDITSLEFMRSLVHTFNLVISQTEKQNEFRIEPLPWYFNEDDRTERDWTEYLDISQAHEVSALNFNLPKQINWKGKYNENETYNREYFELYQLVFGERRFLTPFNIPKGELTMETIFSPLPTDFISGSTNVIIPQLYYVDNNARANTIGRVPQPRQNSPHLFFWAGNRYFFKDFGDTSVGNQRNWYLLSGTTPIAQTTYPFVSHISSLESQNASQVSDLNFYASTDFYFDVTSPFIKYVQNTTYRYFWETYIDNLYSPEARKFTGKFLMSPKYYSDLKLTDKIWIKDASYRIDTISNANLVEPASTQITLIKDLGLYYKDTLWAPAIGIAPNSAYPPGPPCIVYGFVAIFNFDDFLICDRDTPTDTFYSTDSQGLVEGALIYTTSGCTSPADTGLYLRLTGDTEVFVIDTLGQAQSNGFC